MRSLALLLSAVLVAPSTAFAAEPVAVDIETSNLDGEGPTLEKQLGERVAGALSEEGMDVDSTTEHRRVRIRVHRNEVFGYEVDVRIQIDGDVVQPGVAPFVCDPCRVLDLYDRVEGTVPQVVAAIREHEAPPTAPIVEANEPNPVVPLEEPIGPVTHDVPRKASVIGPLGIAGAIVATAGLGGLIFGGLRLGQPDTVTRSPTEDQREIHEGVSTQGWTWFSIGVGGAVVGATMLAIDLTVLRRQRKRRLSLGPDLRPGMGGVVLRGHF